MSHCFPIIEGAIFVSEIMHDRIHGDAINDTLRRRLSKLASSMVGHQFQKWSLRA